MENPKVSIYEWEKTKSGSGSPELRESCVLCLFSRVVIVSVVSTDELSPPTIRLAMTLIKKDISEMIHVMIYRGRGTMVSHTL